MGGLRPPQPSFRSFSPSCFTAPSVYRRVGPQTVDERLQGIVLLAVSFRRSSIGNRRLVAGRQVTVKRYLEVRRRDRRCREIVGGLCEADDDVAPRAATSASRVGNLIIGSSLRFKGVWVLRVARSAVADPGWRSRSAVLA